MYVRSSMKRKAWQTILMRRAYLQCASTHRRIPRSTKTSKYTIRGACRKKVLASTIEATAIVVYVGPLMSTTITGGGQNK